MLKLETLLNDPAYAAILEVTEEQQKINDSLFSSPRLETYKKHSMTLNDSLSLLGYKK